VDLVAVTADGGPGFVSTPPSSRSSATTTTAGERRRHGWKIRPAVLVNNRRRSAVMLLSSGEMIIWPGVQSCVTTAGPEVSDVITKQRLAIMSAANITAKIG